eukprot:TRINITY_DN4096_c0_g1_i1.p1 TRINITY_DN4096_c0_g1~~TRINITY_DN4096_c0_g1_i1.p1  ORF type:complete len:789 (+),score=95.98 TRINITY_DN4096_c0_g1_i1:134-2500(+)
MRSLVRYPGRILVLVSLLQFSLAQYDLFNATEYPDEIQLTPSQGGKAGVAYLQQPLTIRSEGTYISGFRATWAWKVNQSSYYPADGFAFFLRSGPKAVGRTGGYKGIPAPDNFNRGLAFDWIDDTNGRVTCTDFAGNNYGGLNIFINSTSWHYFDLTYFHYNQSAILVVDGVSYTLAPLLLFNTTNTNVTVALSAGTGLYYQAHYLKKNVAVTPLSNLSMVTTQSLTTQAVTTQPLTTNALTTRPLTTKVLTTKELTTQPLTTSPLTTKPLTTSPLTTKSLTTSPLTTKPLTTSSLTTKPLTTLDLTTKPLTTLDLTTQPLTTEDAMHLETRDVTTQEVTTQPLTTFDLATQSLTTAFETNDTVVAPETSDESPTLENWQVYVIVGSAGTGMIIIVVIVIVVRQKKSPQNSGRDADDLFDSNEGSSLIMTSQTWQVEHKDITLENKLGQGSFGEVFKGEWRNQTVAVKKVKQGVDTTDFMEEANLMLKLRPHENVVQLLGVCSDPLCIVLKYYENGSLHRYLRNTASVAWNIKVGVMKGIAAGMAHLHAEKVIHRDLAARNILLGAKMEAIVADFGFARLLNTESDVGETENSLGPIKHMAPESIMKQIYGEKTDAWAFGVTCYEIVTQAEPYLGMSHGELIVEVSKGYRLELPKDLDRTIANMIRRCWLENPDERPTLQECYRILNNTQQHAADMKPERSDGTLHRNYYYTPTQQYNFTPDSMQAAQNFDTMRTTSDYNNASLRSNYADFDTPYARETHVPYMHVAPDNYNNAAEPDRNSPVVTVRR